LKQQNLILFSILSFLVGVFLGIFKLNLLLMIFLFYGILIIFLFILNKKLFRDFPNLQVSKFVVLIWSIFFVIGFWRATIFPRSASQNEIGTLAPVNSAKIWGTVCQFPDKRFNKTYFVFCAEFAEIPGKFSGQTLGKILVSTENFREINFGEKLKISGNLQLPEKYDEFDYKNFLAIRKIFVFSIFPKIELISNNYKDEEKFNQSNNFIKIKNFWLEKIWQLRKKFNYINQQIFPVPQSALSAGILVGDRSGFSEKWENYFRRTGLSHILALSGFNITILILAVFWFFSFLPKIWRLIITGNFLLIFIIFVGGGSSIIRAGIMGGIGLLVVHFGRQKDALFLLSLASFLMIIFQPLILVFDVSFQLSAAGVLGMYFFTDFFKKLFEKFFKNIFLIEILAATISAQIGVMPIILKTFGNISIVAPIANLVVEPIIPVAMLFSFLAIFFGYFSVFLGKIFGFVAHQFLSFLLFFIEKINQIPGIEISLKIGKITFVFILLITLMLGFLCRRFSKKKSNIEILNQKHY